MAKHVKRSDFLLGTAATAVTATHAQPAIAEAVVAAVPKAAAVPSAVSASPMGTWWVIYTTWNPGIQRYPGSLLMPWVRAAELGDARSIAYLKGHGFYEEIQALLGMLERAETIYPKSAAYGKPALTEEQRAMATVLTRSHP